MVRRQQLQEHLDRSPDTLDFVWVQTEQNAFRSGSLNSLIFPRETRFGARGFEGGDVIERFDQLLPASGGPERRLPLRRVENGTMTRVDLAQPLAPGAQAVFDVAWHFLIPVHGADRMGRDGDLGGAERTARTLGDALERLKPALQAFAAEEAS